MEFRDLKKQYRELKTQIDSEIELVLKNSNFIMGNQVGELESELARYVGRKHCITCANGTDALQLAAMALNLSENDAVFLPDFTFFSTGEIVSLVGATPIFVDVDYDTFNISIDSLKDQIRIARDELNLNPKAVIAVDIFGLPADFKDLELLCKSENLYLIEDGAQGFGGSIDGKKACSFGHISTTSFFPAKPLGCYGDGGAIFTDDDNIAELIKSLRIHGKGKNKYDNVRIGLNSRLDTIQAAILKVKLKHFEEFELKKVNEIAKLYTNSLREVVKTPTVPEGFYSSWAQYTIKLEKKEIRDELKDVLKSKNIPSMVYYEKAMHVQEAFAATTVINSSHYDVTNKLCDSVLSLPMHPYLEIEEIEEIINTIKKYFNR